MSPLSPEIQTFLLAMTPVGGFQLSIPVALTVYRLDWSLAYLISVAGSLIPVVFLLLFLEPVSLWLSQKFKIFQYFFSWLFEKTKRKYNSKMEKANFLAPAIFIIVSLPVTGGWTSSLIAFLFGIPFKIAFAAISLGIMIASLIILLVTQAGIAIEKYFGWQSLIGILLISGFIYWFYKRRNKNNRIDSKVI